MVKTCKKEGCVNKEVAITRDGAQFCVKCGGKLSEIEVCDYCQHEFYPQDKFCEFCGRPRS